MLKLVEETNKNSKSTGFTHDERMDEEDCIPGTPECHSPLPPGARNVIEEMNDICEDVFSDDVHGTSEIIKSTNENMDPNIPSSTCVLEEDPFMAVYENASSPYLLASENQHGVVSLLNITSDLTPLNTSTLISDLSPFPQPITPTVDNNGQTPMPSPVKTHGEHLELHRNQIPPQQLQDIFKRCQEFLRSLRVQLKTRLPFDDDIFEMMCFLDPQTAVHAEFTSLFNITSKFPNIVSENDIQLIDNEFRELKLNTEVANLLCSTSSREAVTHFEDFWASVSKLCHADNKAQF
ncbi:unnamed protein product [Parnassius apollo]|uniref:(apollo) hypothetical protein n=1 Tax=Parnassius apollo TaxID=110799 RepID=A0A8S3XS73_PARAO|nr:unnamed protein product [Parnassius apollo]